MINIKQFSKYLTFYVEIIILFFILSIITDFIEKIDLNYTLNLPKTNKYLKLCFLVYSIIVISTYKFSDKKIKQSLIFIPTCFFSLFFIKTYYINQIPALVRNFYFIGTLPFFYIVKEQGLLKLKTYLIPVLKMFLVINFFAIVIGLIFQLELFKTYTGERFGFNGVLLNQVQPNYLYTSLLFIFYKKSNLFLYMTIFCGLVLGTKAFYGIGLIFTFVVAYDLIKENSKKNKKKALIIISFSLTIIVVLFYILLTSSLFKNIIIEKGLATAFFSYRNIYLLEILNSINNQNFSLLYGTICLPDYRSEFSFIDIVLFLGLFGLIFYFIILKSIYKIFINNPLGKSYFVLTMIIACFSGNFFSFPFNCFMFMLTLLYLYTNVTKTI